MVGVVVCPGLQRTGQAEFPDMGPRRTAWKPEFQIMPVREVLNKTEEGLWDLLLEISTTPLLGFTRGWLLTYVCLPTFV